MSIVKSDIWSEIKVDSPLSGEGPLFALVSWDDIRNLEGKLLTIVDASSTDGTHRKAVKDLVRQAIWWHWATNLDTDPSVPDNGMPIE